MGVRTARRIKENQKSFHDFEYTGFDQLDGNHPFKNCIPEGFVEYPVRTLSGGHVVYFNFPLAKEMGIISASHPEALNPQLERKLLESFCLQIINEYDVLTHRKFDSTTLKKNKYMATRYLQLQHKDKAGRTSGDGRGIWNGVFLGKGKVWDISSRGTGVTCLAPGSVAASKPLKTGGGEFSYGCGQAEMDELLGAAILAEIIHLQGIGTERVLCVIDTGKGYGIGVRAGQNLLRPAHSFMYLRQNRLADLKASIDYFIQRQKQNGQWKDQSKFKNQYDQLSNQVSMDFAEFMAKLDVDYIFAWLDWDGDNVLTTGGIIDYGSVRQFGIRHDKYRYDDIERFSTTLGEQKHKAKLLVQTFVQISDYIVTGKKKPLKRFLNHDTVKAFTARFELCRADRILYRMGFNELQREQIMENPFLFQAFDKEFTFLESAKISGRTKKVADGINHPALFNMRALFKELPQYLKKHGKLMTADEFFKTGISSFAKSKDFKLKRKFRRHIERFQKHYLKLIEKCHLRAKSSAVLEGICQRSLLLNREDRITGNALIQIVDEILEQRKKGMKPSEVQKLIDQLVFSYIGLPEVDLRGYKFQPREIIRPELYSKLLELVAEFSHDI